MQLVAQAPEPPKTTTTLPHFKRMGRCATNSTPRGQANMTPVPVPFGHQCLSSDVPQINSLWRNRRVSLSVGPTAEEDTSTDLGNVLNNTLCAYLSSASLMSETKRTQDARWPQEAEHHNGTHARGQQATVTCTTKTNYHTSWPTKPEQSAMAARRDAEPRAFSHITR